MCATISVPLQWHHNEHHGVSNYRRLVCSLNRLFRRESKKTSNLRLIGLCGGNPPVTDGFPSQRASNAEYISIWWRQHAYDVHPSHTEQFISLRPDYLVVNFVVSGVLSQPVISTPRFWNLAEFTFRRAQQHIAIFYPPISQHLIVQHA